MKFNQADAVALCGVARNIVNEQEKLNVLYDAEWELNFNKRKVMLAATSEFSEMLEEVKPVWKYYGAASQNDWASALEEFIDVVHFTATIRSVSDKGWSTPEDVLAEWEMFSHASNLTLIHAINASLMCGEFNTLLALGCKLFRVKPEQLFVAYLHKNHKNQARADAGAMTRDISDVKSSELATFDFLYDNGFIAATREEYNMSLDMCVDPNELGRDYA